VKKSSSPEQERYSLSSSGYEILLADDESDILQVLRRGLERKIGEMKRRID
jgi:hypothetical protein